MNKKYYISGEEFTREELVCFLKEKQVDKSIPKWKTDVYDFMMEWLSDNDYVVAHTSGTTGKPKFINLPKKLMKKSALSTVSFLGLMSGDSALLCLSVDYIAGKMMVVRAMECGLNLVMCEPSIEALAALTEKIDFAAMVPYQVSQAMDKFPDIFSNIDSLIIGGASVSSNLLRDIQHINTKCFSTYGMTETMSHIALMSLNCPKDKEYRCLPGIDISIDERCCLVITSWGGETIVTNDIVDIVGVNRFIWKGRYDNVVNSGGVKLIPEILEAKVSGLLEDRYVFSSVHDNKLGEKLILVIESEPYSEDKLTALNQRLNKKLGKYEIPKQIVFIEKFKETTSGKIVRNGIFK